MKSISVYKFSGSEATINGQKIQIIRTEWAISTHFICPVCGSQCKKLFIKDGLMCRLCAGITYPSHRERLDMINETLGSRFPLFQKKPEWMCKNAYINLRRKAARLREKLGIIV